MWRGGGGPPGAMAMGRGSRLAAALRTCWRPTVPVSAGGACRVARAAALAQRPRHSSATAAAAQAPLLVIGVDSGTQSTKACVYDVAQGRLVASAAVPQPVETPAEGYAEQDIGAWRDGLLRAIRDAVDAVPGEYGGGDGPQLVAERVVAVGLSFQRESFTLVEHQSAADAAACEPLQPRRPAILWLDGRAKKEVAEFGGAGGQGHDGGGRGADTEGTAARAGGCLSAAEYHRLTGKPLDVTSAAARLRWLAAHEPAVLQPARAVEDPQPQHGGEAGDGRAGSMAGGTAAHHAPPDWVDCGAVLSHALTGIRATCVAVRAHTIFIHIAHIIGSQWVQTPRHGDPITPHTHG